MTQRTFRRSTTALAGLAALLTPALGATAQIAPAPAQLASVSGGVPVGGVLADYAPGISDDGRLVCFVHALPSGHGVSCAVRGGLAWAAQPWGTFTGAQPGPIGVAPGGGSVAIVSASGALAVCSGSLVFGCRAVPFGLGGTAPDSISTKIVGISADGRYVLAVTAATNVIAGDANGDPDLVRIDTATGAAVPLNLTPGGTLSPTGATGGALSRNGRYAAIVSQDTLVTGQGPTTRKQVFVKDMDTGVIRQASVSFSATNGNDWSGYPVMSDNGRFVGFSSYATNLVAGDGNGEHDLFLRDLDLGRTQRVNIGPSGEQLSAGIGDRWTEPRWLSGDARVVTFSTSDPIFGGRPPQGGNASTALRQVIVHNVVTGVIRIASTSPANVVGDGDSSGIAVSGDGRFVSFASAAGNLRPGAPGIGVYFRNMENASPVAALHVTGGGPAPAVVSADASGSADADGAIIGRRWDFGDGAVAEGATATHTYAAPGTYRVRLVVTDDDGAEASAEQQVVVGSPSITLQGARAQVTWRLGVSRGRVTLTGATSAAVTGRFRLIRSGRTVDLGARAVGAGPFSLALTVPRNLMPGTYRVVLDPGTGAIDLGAVAIPAPAQGIIDRVSVTTRLRGAPLGGVLPQGARRAYVRFRVLVAPRGGARIQARWTAPGGVRWRITAPTPDGAAGRFRFGLAGGRGGALRRGSYVCRLVVGNRTLETVRFLVP